MSMSRFRRVSIGAAIVGTVAVVIAAEPIDRDALMRIRAEGMQRSRVFELFDTLVTVIGPRLTASPAYKRSAEWARERLAGWGLSNPRLEPWEFGRGWALDKLTIELVEPYYLPLIGYAEGWSAPTSAELTATPVYIGDLTSDQVEALGAQLKGAIVLSQPIQASFIREDRPQPSAPDFKPSTLSQAATSTAAAAQAAAQRIAHALRLAEVGAVLRRSGGEHGTVFVTGRDAGADALPRIVLAGEHYNMLVRMLERKVPVKVRVNLQSRFLDADRNGYNVLAELPGTDPQLKHEVVMLGAHLDSWHTATGATDNADGSAIVLEVMRILSAAGVKPRRSIRAALWGGEEQGLHGSRRYVEKYLTGEANAAARDRLSVYFNIDPGTGPIYGFYMENNAAAKQILDVWLEPLRDIGARRNVIEGIGSTDHLNFLRVGVPAFNPIQDYTDYDVRTHHTNVDTIERVREEDLKQCAVVLASVVYHASQREGRFPRLR